MKKAIENFEQALMIEPKAKMAFVHIGACLVDLATTELNAEKSISLIESGLDSYKKASEIPLNLSASGNSKSLNTSKNSESSVTGDLLWRWGSALVTHASLLTKISQRNNTKSIDGQKQIGKTLHYPANLIFSHSARSVLQI